jgi:hypothetical protein
VRGRDVVGRMRTCAEEQSSTEHQRRGEEEGGALQTAGQQVAWSGVVGFLMSERTSEIPHRWRTARKRQKRPGGSDRGCRRRAEAAGPDSVLRGGGQGARVRRRTGGEDRSG